MFFAGAFTGAISAFVFGNVALGFTLAALGGAATGSLLAFATARCRADQMVAGLAVNVLVLGLSSFLLRGLFGGRAPVIRRTPRAHGRCPGSRRFRSWDLSCFDSLRLSIWRSYSLFR